MSAINTVVLASAKAKMDNEAISKCKFMNKVIPMGVEGFRTFGQMTVNLTKEEADAIYFGEILGDNGTVGTPAELQAWCKENLTDSAATIDEFVAKAKGFQVEQPITILEWISMLHMELQLPPALARQLGQQVGIPDELSAEQQKVRNAWEQRERNDKQVA